MPSCAAVLHRRGVRFWLKGFRSPHTRYHAHLRSAARIQLFLGILSWVSRSTDAPRDQPCGELRAFGLREGETVAGCAAGAGGPHDPALHFQGPVSRLEDHAEILPGNTSAGNSTIIPPAPTYRAIPRSSTSLNCGVRPMAGRPTGKRGKRRLVDFHFSCLWRRTPILIRADPSFIWRRCAEQRPKVTLGSP